MAFYQYKKEVTVAVAALALPGFVARKVKAGK